MFVHIIIIIYSETKCLYAYLFVRRYMNRRCRFLDELPGYNYNIGAGEVLYNEKRSDTRKLGSTIMETMLAEVENFCDPKIKDNWTCKPHQQVDSIATEYTS